MVRNYGHKNEMLKIGENFLCFLSIRYFNFLNCTKNGSKHMLIIIYIDILDRPKNIVTLKPNITH